MKVLSLFSGGGLGDLGLMAAGMEIVGQCEIDPWCQKLLAIRYPDTVKWTDIRTVTGAEVKNKIGTVDVVAGGFPCQPFSVAGDQRGCEDDRNLWPEMLRIISEVRPTWIIGENVSGFIDIALDDVLNDLEMAGYESIPIVFPSCAIGTWHKRERCFIVAHTTSIRSQKRSKKFKDFGLKTSGTLADYCFKGTLQQDGRVWPGASRVRRVAHGIADRVHRLKCLGNGQVPACTAFIGEKIMEFDRRLV